MALRLGTEFPGVVFPVTIAMGNVLELATGFIVGSKGSQRGQFLLLTYNVRLASIRAWLAN